jgi:hypothetical protein
MTTRFTRKDATVTSLSCCCICGTAYGGRPGSAQTGAVCDISTCKACGTHLCQSHGLSSGHCPVCFIGILTKWSGCDRPCDVKGCTNAAVAAPRRGRWVVCREHLGRVRVGNATAEQLILRALEDRAINWIEVGEDRLNTA